MKKLYLTFDIEPLVNKRSFNPTVYNSMLVAGTFIARELQKRNLKGTFYVSLSRKTSSLDPEAYEDSLHCLLSALSTFKNISVQPHLHAFDLPLNFNTENDLFGSYDQLRQVEMLRWAKLKLEGYGFEVNSFRPGSYSINNTYYDALQMAGYSYSSILRTANESVNIDLLAKSYKESPLERVGNIMEFPVTSVKMRSIKGNTEVINLSPDFFTLESIQPYFDKMNYVNVNFHSFSVFSHKFLRENHKHIILKNLKYFFFDKPLNSFLRGQNIETIIHDTVLRKEFIRWIDYFSEEKFQTYFIGEQ